MILDANVLLYAADDSAPHHTLAKEFLEDHLNGDVRVGLPWQSVTAFLRISTHPRVMASPLSGPQASELVSAWLNAPAAWMPDVTQATWALLRTLIDRHRITGNLIPDAQLAALALQYGVPVVSADADFARFPEADWVNPFA